MVRPVRVPAAAVVTPILPPAMRGIGSSGFVTTLMASRGVVMLRGVKAPSRGVRRPVELRGVSRAAASNWDALGCCGGFTAGKFLVAGSCTVTLRVEWVRACERVRLGS